MKTFFIAILIIIALAFIWAISIYNT
ncbi:TPA: LemA family protein, partial [Legionella pneumophila]|nr:LemA family protein [Legionella pneumophila]